MQILKTFWELHKVSRVQGQTLNMQELKNKKCTTNSWKIVSSSILGNQLICCSFYYALLAIAQKYPRRTFKKKPTCTLQDIKADLESKIPKKESETQR